MAHTHPELRQTQTVSYPLIEYILKSRDEITEVCDQRFVVLQLISTDQTLVQQQRFMTHLNKTPVNIISCRFITPTQLVIHNNDNI